MASRSAKETPPPPQWVQDLHSKPPHKPSSSNIPDPPGYSAAISSKSSKSVKQAAAIARKPPTTEETDTLKLKKSWELALAPAKALPMNAVMMYMSGNTLQIFSIMMVFMLFKNPVQGLLQTQQVFSRFESEGTRGRMWLVKVTYVLLNLLALGLGVWKVNGMGLLPTTRSDWLAWETERVPLEHTIFALG
ncbi:hypothetical protein MMC09_000793 [Bachmanniomyces sp. S44760]|nr:hypothetical protein [Bachmanniomyces sp. S44760]